MIDRRTFCSSCFLPSSTKHETIREIEKSKYKKMYVSNGLASLTLLKWWEKKCKPSKRAKNIRTIAQYSWGVSCFCCDGVAIAAVAKHLSSFKRDATTMHLKTTNVEIIHAVTLVHMKKVLAVEYIIDIGFVHVSQLTTKPRQMRSPIERTSKWNGWREEEKMH